MGYDNTASPLPQLPAVNVSPQQSAFSSILGAVPVVGGVLNGITQMFTNSSNRKWQVKMYKRQRADALADWNMQNEYNSPAAQMARLKAAGLNPNLVYGNGAQATAQSMPRASSAGNNVNTAPRFDISGMFPMLMFQLKEQMQSQQIENLKTQNLVMQSQVNKNIAGTESLETQTQLTRFNLEMAETLKDVNIQIANGNLRNINVRSDVMLAANERAAAMQSSNLAIAAQNVLRLRLENEMNPLRRQLIQAQIDNIDASTELRQQTIDLQKKGFTWSDPYYFRVGSSIVDKLTNIDMAEVKKAAPAVDWKQFMRPIY